jgi:ABC-type glutathione transport system ATPase component
MLSKEMNVAVLIVEHRIELLESIADRVIVMDAGEIIARGELADQLKLRFARMYPKRSRGIRGREKAHRGHLPKGY